MYSANTYWASECPRHRRYGPVKDRLYKCPPIKVEISGIEGLGCTCMGNRMVSLMGREAAIPAKASARLLSARLISRFVHSVNCCKVFLTLAKYHAMRASLASYSSWTCFTTSCESLWIRSLETDRARARSNPDRMASYSASLLEAGNPSRMACSKCSPVGDYSSSPTPEPDEREAPSTRRVHHSFLTDSSSFSLLNLVCAECCEGVGQLTLSPGGLGNRAGAFGQRSEGLRLLAPFLNIWFLRLPMPAKI
ncbi:hypothetical protein CK203_027553 [Vitis vinifera]|uniref:Uncharacterized protein n=1 Tax=Vitis vinifera TaxID=29760 RepID=A0A438JBI3_VITVI|nr:hypothetical protein CK203_027553 [Vitis vinifera]